MLKLININEMETKPFETSESGYKEYNGLTFNIVRELIVGDTVGCEVDPECAPMFKIRFDDDMFIDAFAEEIFTDKSLDKMVLKDVV